MGLRVAHTCPACGLTGCVSGGDDGGELAVTTTIYCQTCETLQDVVLCENWFAKPRVEVEPRCRKSKSHQIVVWNREQPCPRCGQVLLTMDEAKGMVLWD